MAIIKKVKTSNYSVIDNNLLQNTNLTYEAKGLLCELLSRPSNWRIYKSQLKREHTKITKINRIFKELIENSYLCICNLRDSKSKKIKDRVWVISEHPFSNKEIDIMKKDISKSTIIDMKMVENLNDGKPQFEETSIKGNQPLQNTDYILNKKKIKKKYIPPEFLNYSKEFIAKQKQNHSNLTKQFGGKEIEAGATEIDKLVRMDKFDFEKEIKPVLNWAIDNDFWATNILSLASLRKKSKTNELMKFINIYTAYNKDNGIKNNTTAESEFNMLEKHFENNTKPYEYQEKCTLETIVKMHGFSEVKKQWKIDREKTFEEFRGLW